MIYYWGHYIYVVKKGTVRSVITTCYNDEKNHNSSNDFELGPGLGSGLWG